MVRVDILACIASGGYYFTARYSSTAAVGRQGIYLRCFTDGKRLGRVRVGGFILCFWGLCYQYAPLDKQGLVSIRDREV